MSCSCKWQVTSHNNRYQFCLLLFHSQATLLFIGLVTQKWVKGDSPNSQEQSSLMTYSIKSKKNIEWKIMYLFAETFFALHFIHFIDLHIGSCVSIKFDWKGSNIPIYLFGGKKTQIPLFIHDFLHITVKSRVIYFSLEDHDPCGSPG